MAQSTASQQCLNLYGAIVEKIHVIILMAFQDFFLFNLSGDRNKVFLVKSHQLCILKPTFTPFHQIILL